MQAEYHTSDDAPLPTKPGRAVRSGRRAMPVVRLVALALLSLGALLLLSHPTGHDPLWWHHAGLKKRAPRVRELRHNATPPAFRRLVNGTDYFADYDINKIRLDPEPKIGENERRYFSYIKPEEHPEYAMRYVSNRPRVLLIQDLMTPEECDALIEAASPNLQRSRVSVDKSSKDTKPINDIRTSTQAWLDAEREPAKPIVDRILALAGFAAGSHGKLQVLRYKMGEKYNAHTDYFPLSESEPKTVNRAITVFLYLNDVVEGGETQFPRADGKPPTFDLSSCTHGLRVHPRKGQAALFYDMQPNGKLDPYSLHGGCPVKQGVKWGGTLWLRVPTGGS
jgi:prolyl 4-hydroxylase